MSAHNQACYRVLVSLAILACLVACDHEHGQTSLETYQERLLNVLDIELAESDEGKLGKNWKPFSSIESVLIPADATTASISLLDFLSLYGCELQLVIGETNSILGRLAESSQTLINELEFLRLAPDCSRQLEEGGDDELASELLSAIETKRNQLPRKLVSALLGGPEARAFWKAPYHLDAYPEQASINVPQAWQALADHSRAWLQGRRYKDTQGLENTLFEVQKGDGGSLLKSYLLLHNRLSLLNERLGLFLAHTDACPRQYDQKILENVILNFFVGDVQVWAAALSKRQYELMPPIHAIEESLGSALSVDYGRWRHWRDTLFFATQEEIKQHVVLLKALTDANTCLD